MVLSQFFAQARRERSARSGVADGGVAFMFEKPMSSTMIFDINNALVARLVCVVVSCSLNNGRLT